MQPQLEVKKVGERPPRETPIPHGGLMVSVRWRAT